MSQKITAKIVAKNATISILAQIISLITSLIVNLILPKFISEFQYANWQTYILYSSYVGILHLGILDGIVLKYSKFDYNELDGNLMKTNFSFLIILLFTFSATGILISVIYDQSILLILVSLSIITKNFFMFASYSFQITNRISNYATMIIVQRLTYALLIVTLLAVGVKNYIIICLFDLLVDIIGFLYTLPFNKKIYGLPKINISKYFFEIKSSIIAGSMLMIANFSSNLIIGSTKMFIHHFWSKSIFAKIAFSFSITNIFLTFVMAISVVLFPSIKRLDSKKLPSIYKKMRLFISPVLLSVLVLYFPMCILLRIWLPNYSDSLVYTGILLPISMYTIRVSLITNNFLKALRKEKELLIINVSCILIELLGSFIIVLMYKNLFILLIWTVLVSMMKTVVSEFFLSKIMRQNFYKIEGIEFVMSIIFVYLTTLNNLIGLFIYSVLLISYFIFNKKNYKDLYDNYLNKNRER